MKQRLRANLFWLLLAVAGGWAFVTLATNHDQPISSGYILTAALCTYAIGYRFYSKWIAARVLMLNDRRATPCEVHDDGKDFVKTNKWIVFGHHFAAISGPGPLVGPVLAAQFGYLPGTLWILIGVVLGGAVQDFVILFSSLRRNGKSLGQMLKEEMNSTAGYIAIVAILAIIVILLAVLALVIVNTLAESPWGVFTVGATIPIALLMGGYLGGFWRVEQSPGGIGPRCGMLLLLAVWGRPICPHAWRSRAETDLRQRNTRVVAYHLRFGGERAPGLAAAGSAGLSQHVHEVGNNLRAGGGHPAGAAGFADARAQSVHGRLGAGRAGENISLLFYHHCLRRHLRFSHADFKWHRHQKS